MHKLSLSNVVNTINVELTETGYHLWYTNKIKYRTVY